MPLTLKPLLRRLARHAFPPALYRLTARASARLFQSLPAVQSIYLCRGCAKNEITPGISDIDFLLFLHPHANPRPVHALFRALHLATLGLVEYSPVFVLTPAELLAIDRSIPVRRFRFREAQATARLLHGPDILAALPPLSPLELSAACFAEMSYWWVRFASFFFQPADPLLRRSIRDKAVAELSNAALTLRTGVPCYSRAEGLARESRHLTSDEAAFQFLLATFQATWQRFATEPFLEILPGVQQSLANPSRPLHSALFPPGQPLELLPPNTLAHLQQQVSAHQGPALLYLHDGPLAFPLTPQLPRDLYRGVLTPATAPDLFLQLQITPVYWTTHTRWFLTEWRDNGQWPGLSPAQQDILDQIAAGAARGHIVYP